MKTMAGARVRACWNRSRTRAAPTPTNISTKLEPVTDRNGTCASPATARASRVFPVPGGPAISTPRGPRAPARVAQVVDDLADLGLDLGIAGHIGEPGSGALGVDDPRLGLGQAGHAAGAAEAGGVPPD